MCYERQPRSPKCSCGHSCYHHEDVERPLLSENKEGRCRRCACPGYDGLPPIRPDWAFLVFGGEATTKEWELRGPPPQIEEPRDKPESYYRDLLALQVGGKTEVTLPFGRADVMTDTTVWEVEPASRWTDGVAQALQYAAQVQQRGAVALYGNGVLRDKVRAKLASLPEPGLELWWLEEGRFVRLDT